MGSAVGSDNPVLFIMSSEMTKNILAALEQSGAEFSCRRHAPLSSAAERVTKGLTFGARVCKNLLVTTRTESRFILVMCPFEKEVDLKALRTAMGTSRLCFASEERLLEKLGERPGSVSVLGVINDRTHEVEVVFDLSLKNEPLLAMHPADNSMSVLMSFSALERFVRRCGNPIFFFDFY